MKDAGGISASCFFSARTGFILSRFCVSGIGFLVLLALIGRPVHLQGTGIIHMLVFAAFLSILGYQILNVGLYAKLFAVKQGYLESDSTLNWFARHLRLETRVVLGLILFGAGLVLNLGSLLNGGKMLSGRSIVSANRSRG